MNALPPVVYMILALAAFTVAGGLFVWVIGYIRGKGEQNVEDPPVASPGVEDPVRMSESPPSSPELPPESKLQPPAEEVLLRVSRVGPGNDGLAIFVQGKRYRYLREIRDPQTGKETVEALNAVLAFAEGWLPARTQLPSRPEPKPEPPRRTASAEEEEAFLARLRQSELFPPEETSPGLLGQLGRRKSSSALDSIVPPAEAINELVQKRLASRPEFSGYNIRITTVADGSLRIHVGIETFSAVDEIQDTEVRALIQDAIREWGS